MSARISIFAFVICSLLSLGGCFSTSGKGDTPREQFRSTYQPRNISSDAELPVTLRRVVLLPACWDADPDSDFLPYLDSLLNLSLQRSGAFEIVPIGRAQMHKLFGKEQFSSAGILPDNLLPDIMNLYAADGIVFVDVTVNRPYRPLALGLRARILDIRTMKVVWSVDALFDSSDPAVARAASAYARRSTFNPHPVDVSSGILQSPKAFANFAVDTLFATLPLRSNE